MINKFVKNIIITIKLLNEDKQEYLVKFWIDIRLF